MAFKYVKQMRESPSDLHADVPIVHHYNLSRVLENFTDSNLTKPAEYTAPMNSLPQAAESVKDTLCEIIDKCININSESLANKQDGLQPAERSTDTLGQRNKTNKSIEIDIAGTEAATPNLERSGPTLLNDDIGKINQKSVFRTQQQFIKAWLIPQIPYPGPVPINYTEKSDDSVNKRVPTERRNC